MACFLQNTPGLWFSFKASGSESFSIYRPFLWLWCYLFNKILSCMKIRCPESSSERYPAKMMAFDGCKKATTTATVRRLPPFWESYAMMSRECDEINNVYIRRYKTKCWFAIFTPRKNFLPRKRFSDSQQEKKSCKTDNIFNCWLAYFLAFLSALESILS